MTWAWWQLALLAVSFPLLVWWICRMTERALHDAEWPDPDSYEDEYDDDFDPRDDRQSP